MKRLLIVTVLLLLPTCKIPPINLPVPTPTPTPTPTPPPVVCLPDVPWCTEGQTCSTPEKPCKHNPTANPDCCELAPACVVTPPPPPSSECNPVLNPTLGAPANDDANWKLATDQATTTGFKQAVWQAVQAAQAACPDAWNGNCMKAGVPGIDQGYLLIAKELQRVGWSASQAKDSGGKVYDHLYVRRIPGSSDWNATKLFYYGNGCLITGDGAFTVHGWYTFIGSDPTSPPVEPPSTGACSDPLPPKVWTAGTLPPGWGQDEIGKPRWLISCKPHFNVIDCTAKIAPQACSYCISIGMGEMADGTPRCECPVRKEDAPDRVACEAYLTGGTKLEDKNGADCSLANNNPFQFWPSSGNCRLCSAEDPRVCGEWF